MFCLKHFMPNLTLDNDHWMTVDPVDRVIRAVGGTKNMTIAHLTDKLSLTHL